MSFDRSPARFEDRAFVGEQSIAQDTMFVPKVARYVNMTDIKKSDKEPAPNSLAPRDEAIRQGIELLFFAYRDFTAEPDAILAQSGFGRAHHRVVHFVGRHPHMTVGELLGILRITKQSLNRVLGQLVRERVANGMSRVRVSTRARTVGQPSPPVGERELLAYTGRR